MPEQAFIYEAVRTPRGKQRGGSLHSVKPVDLASGLIDGLLARHEGLDPKDIDDVILGVVSPVGEQGAVIARTAALNSGLGESVPGTQINRFCSSGLEATNLAAAKVASGFDELILAGGVESMSRVPMGSDGGALFSDPTTAYDHYIAPQGIGADLIATIEGFSREDIDGFAAESQARADVAWKEGRFAKSIIPVKDINGVTLLDTDEHRRAGTTVEGLAKLKPAFAAMAAMAGFDDVAMQKYPNVERINHVHTGGNSSGIVDGSGLVLVGSEEAGKRNGLTPRGRIVSYAQIGSEPTIMLTGPTPATELALKRAGLTTEDIDVYELNEAFASVVMKWMKDLNIPHEKVNVNGGAIALGHPLGATGAMILGTCLDELERTGGRYGLVTLCIGGGMGVATVIERL